MVFHPKIDGQWRHWLQKRSIRFGIIWLIKVFILQSEKAVKLYFDSLFSVGVFCEKLKKALK